MNTPPVDQHVELEGDAELARRLSAATGWNGPERGLWKAAAAGQSPWGSLSRPIPGRMLGMSALAVVVGLALVALLVPSLGRARSSVGARPAMSAGAAFGTSDHDGAGRGLVSTETWREVEKNAAGSPAPSRKSGQGTSADGARQVIRKASVTIAVADVRAAFAQATLVLSEASGEFVQESSLVGSDDEPRTLGGTLTLRVASTRLSAVLGQLRALGVVVQETSTGEDVTDQVVDVEARLRNEQRVENELLGLLESRKGSPLKDVLELRDSLRNVREQIERLTAQRDRLSRLVSLSTVVVSIRHRDALVTSERAAVTTGERFARAARDGVETLSRSAAWVVKVAIGGLVWWVILGGGAVLAWALVRRSQRRAAREPAPLL